MRGSADTGIGISSPYGGAIFPDRGDRRPGGRDRASGRRAAGAAPVPRAASSCPRSWRRAWRSIRSWSRTRAAPSTTSASWPRTPSTILDPVALELSRFGGSEHSRCRSRRSSAPTRGPKGWFPDCRSSRPRRSRRRGSTTAGSPRRRHQKHARCCARWPIRDRHRGDRELGHAPSRIIRPAQAPERGRPRWPRWSRAGRRRRAASRTPSATASNEELERDDGVDLFLRRARTGPGGRPQERRLLKRAARRPRRGVRATSWLQDRPARRIPDSTAAQLKGIDRAGTRPPCCAQDRGVAFEAFLASRPPAAPEC